MGYEFHDFGQAELVDAEALGKPGNRRFRLIARSRRGSASLWLEKEQLLELAKYLDQLLSENSDLPVLRVEVQVPPPEPPHAPRDFPRHPDVEFQVGQLQIGIDTDQEILLLRAAPLTIVEHDGELEAEADDPQFSTYLTRAQADRLAGHILVLIANGRPRCPVCGAPMQEHHVCAKMNGFHPVGLN